MVQQITSIQELKQQISKPQLVVVDFFATWCGPCKRISPYIESLSQQYRDVTFIKVDCDEAEAIATQYQIEAMPTFVFIKNGMEVERFSGANQSKLLDTITRLK